MYQTHYGVPLSYDLITFQIPGQKFSNFFVGILVQTITPKGHFEINWPLDVHIATKLLLSVMLKNQILGIHFQGTLIACPIQLLKMFHRAWNLRKGHKYQARKAKRTCGPCSIFFNFVSFITFLHFKMSRNNCEIHFSLKSTNISCFTLFYVLLIFSAILTTNWVLTPVLRQK